MSLTHLEKQERALLKVYFTGGSINYMVMPWESAQRALREHRHALRFKYTRPEEWAKLLDSIEDEGMRRMPYINYFFLREDGELDGVIDLMSVSGMAIDEVPMEENQKEKEAYSKVMIETAKIQAEMMKRCIREMDKGEDWKSGSGGNVEGG